jgi:hypothetical protein
MAGSVLATIPVLLVIRLQARRRAGIQKSLAWSISIKAYALALSAWQVAIIGVLNMLGFAQPPRKTIMPSYIVMIIFLVLSYKMIAIADGQDQEGGAMPVNFFGRPRSRRILFVGSLYSPIGLLAFGGIIIFLTWKRYYPVQLQPPLLCLLLTGLSSALTAGLVFHRYRMQPSDVALARQVALLTLIVVLCAGAITITFAYSLYGFELSSIAIACIAETLYWTSLAKEERSETSF